jgi:tetratricopeptide (TPR) repeat protein
MKTNEPAERPKHLLPEHAAPDLHHHPEEDETVLARWLREAMAQGARFWLGLAGILALVVALWAVSTMRTDSSSQASESWRELILAQNPEALEAAGRAPTGPAANWILLRSGESAFNEGVRDLASNRDAALEHLKTAHGRFREAFEKAAAEAPEKPLAALGMARTLEARGELDEAIRQYDLVVKTWPESPWAAEAKSQAEVLKQPASQAFYKELAAFKPAPVTLPPGGSSPLGGIPGLQGLPGLPDMTSPGAMDDLPPLSAPVPVEPAPSNVPTPTPSEPQAPATAPVTPLP